MPNQLRPFTDTTQWYLPEKADVAFETFYQKTPGKNKSRTLTYYRALLLGVVSALDYIIDHDMQSRHEDVAHTLLCRLQKIPVDNILAYMAYAYVRTYLNNTVPGGQYVFPGRALFANLKGDVIITCQFLYDVAREHQAKNP